MFFGKRPRHVIFELTNRCNLKCRMCDIWKEQPKEDFDIDLFERVLRDKLLSHVESICFTGGEPMMAQDLTIYYQITKKYLPESFVNLSTNGSFKARVVKFLEEADVKKTSVTISYDGIHSHDAMRGVKGSARAVLKTASQIRDRYPAVKLALKFTITKWNYQDTLTTARSVSRLRIPFHIKIVEDIRCHQNRMKSLGTDAVFNEEEMAWIRRYSKQLLDDKLVENRVYTATLMRKCRIDALTCTWPTGRLFIGLNGNVFLCRKKEAIGNVVTDNIGDIWKSKQTAKTKDDMRNCQDTGCLSYDHH
jgi:MoaA/NifB/PqqE/SkfB family radical SAM enzyme